MRACGVELGGGAVIKEATVALPTIGWLAVELDEEVVVLLSESDIED